MDVTWFGQAAFLLEGDGTEGPIRVITDPYTPEALGYAPIAETADVVIRSSHDDEAHSRADLVPGAFALAEALEAARKGDGPQQAQAGPLPFAAILAREGDNRPGGARPGDNAMYAFEIDGMRIAHMGDIGTDLNAAQTDFLRGTDVLLALTGGGLVVSLEELDRVIREVRPRIVIPMHFRTLTYRPRNSHWIEAFLAYHDEARIDFAFGPRATITQDALPHETRVLVLDYLR